MNYGRIKRRVNSTAAEQTLPPNKNDIGPRRLVGFMLAI